jgi:hypothetical protein
MTIKAVRATITLGDIDLSVYQLPDGKYASPELFRLYTTDIYWYQGCWYWVSPNGLPDMDAYRWEDEREAFLAFQGNRLSYLYLDAVDDEREIGDDNVEYSYAPVPDEIYSVIRFCAFGKLLSEEVIDSLIRMLKQCHSGGFIVRQAAQALLLMDTENDLRRLSPKNKITNKENTPKDRKGFIYLVELDAHLKLGFTQNLNQRLKSFKTTNAKVALIKSVKGTLQQEKNLHSVLGSKVRELYDLEDQQRIIEAMSSDCPR